MIDHQIPISVIHLPVFCNHENNTPQLPSLMLACYHGNVNCVDVLLEFGAKWTVKDKSGLCPQPRENCITAASRLQCLDLVYGIGSCFSSNTHDS